MQLWTARAQAWAVGGHVGLNLDHGDIHIGADLQFPLAQLSPSTRLSIWPSIAHVFIDGGHDVELLGVDLPFEFRIASSIVTPFVGPGLGLAIHDHVDLKLNVIGGLFLEAGGGVRPFAELALRFVNGTYVDFLTGVVFEF
jgi:hypothetical protein